MAPREHRIDLNLFRILDAIYVHGGIGAAARALHLTQPAVTHALNRLRAHFDDPLFVRQGNRVAPTERTRAVIAEVQQHLHGLQAASRIQSAFAPAALDLSFAVGFRDALESIVLPSLLARVGAAAPGVRLVSRRIAADQIERALSAGQVDLVVDRRLAAGPRLVSEFLLEDSLAVALRRTHPLAAGPLRRADYFAARHVAVSPLGEPHTLDVLLGQDGRHRQIQLTCQHYFAAAQVAAAGELLLTLPRSSALHLARLLPLAIQPLPLKLKPFPILAYWHESKRRDQAHAWLRRQVAEAVRALAPELGRGRPEPAG